ncbi:MAG: OmpA family protein [Phreatobacter sp.]
MTIEGHMPSEAWREALVAEARSLLPGLVVTDLIEIAAGVPEGADWQAAGRFLVLQALRLRQGELRIRGTELTVRGEPADRSGLVALNNALQPGRLPRGLRLAAAEIAPPRVSPYVWSAVRQADMLLLRGYVPSAADGAAARALAATLFAGLTVRDEQVVAAGAPEGFAGAVAAALGHLALLEEGRADLSDRTLAIAGAAPSDVAAAAAGAAIMASAPFGYAVRHAIAAPPPPPPPAPSPPPAPPDTCSPRIAEVMAGGGIVFQFGRESLRPDSLQRLRRIAEILKECPQTAFVIEGHTDSDGNPDQNRDLSERRAAAVVSVLIREGIAAARLSAEGLGQTRPLVPNDSPANKARNRRIEFRAVR